MCKNVRNTGRRKCSRISTLFIVISTTVLTYHAATAPKALTVPERESPEGAVAVCATIAIALAYPQRSPPNAHHGARVDAQVEKVRRVDRDASSSRADHAPTRACRRECRAGRWKRVPVRRILFFASASVQRAGACRGPSQRMQSKDLEFARETETHDAYSTSRRGEEKRNGASETEEEPCLVGLFCRPKGASRRAHPRRPHTLSAHDERPDTTRRVGA